MQASLIGPAPGSRQRCTAVRNAARQLALRRRQAHRGSGCKPCDARRVELLGHEHEQLSSDGRRSRVCDSSVLLASSAIKKKNVRYVYLRFLRCLSETLFPPESNRVWELNTHSSRQNLSHRSHTRFCGRPRRAHAHACTDARGKTKTSRRFLREVSSDGIIAAPRADRSARASLSDSRHSRPWPRRRTARGRGWRRRRRVRAAYRWLAARK